MSEFQKFLSLKPENREHFLKQFPYELKKMIAFNENDMISDSKVSWEDFKNNYFQCGHCGWWVDSPCICYAR